MSHTIKTVLITRRQPAATALINRVQEVQPLSAVIYEAWRKQAFEPPSGVADHLRRARREVRRRADYYGKRIGDRLRGYEDLERDAIHRVLGYRHLQIEHQPTTHDVEDRAWHEARAILEADPPDVILVFGTSLIPDRVTEVAKLGAINIHTGLSPHYRGQNCTHFAILNEDLENVGVTVHAVRRAIDGGEIVVQRRPEIAPGDDEFSLNVKNQRLGAELYAEILARLGEGDVFLPVGQPKDVGLLLMNRALTAGHQRLVRELVEGGAIERFVARHAAGKTRPKPIVEALQMGPAPR